MGTQKTDASPCSTSLENYSWCISTPLSWQDRGRDEEGTCVGKGQTQADQGRKTLVESLSTPSSRAGRDTSRGKKPQPWMLLSFLLQMGVDSSGITLLKCIFKKVGTSLMPRILKKKKKKTCLIFFCDTEWPQYHLEDGEHWLVEKSQLVLFYN